VRRFGLFGVALVIALIGGSAVATAKPAKPTVYPVQITIKIKSAEWPPGSPFAASGTPAIAAFGRVTSPKAACKQKRQIVALTEIPSLGPDPHEDKSTGIRSDATGRWEGKPFSDFYEGSSYRDALRNGAIRQRAKVARKRIGNGRFCAEAISDYLTG
jgi:hypothetical protein